jgi:GAF domain-containing protein
MIAGESETCLRGQRAALEAALNGAPLRESLGVLTRLAVELFGRKSRAAFYMADHDRRPLHHVVGMGDEYAAAVSGFAIGPESLACGHATHAGRPVMTPDVTTEPLWRP